MVSYVFPCFILLTDRGIGPVSIFPGLYPAFLSTISFYILEEVYVNFLPFACMPDAKMQKPTHPVSWTVSLIRQGMGEC